jgi:hypothetical protein
MQGAIWDATTEQPRQNTGGGQAYVMGDDSGGQGCGCAGCCGSSTAANDAADVETDASVTGGTVTDTVQSLAAPGELSTEDALLVWTAINTLVLAYWAATEVRG